MDFAKHLKAGLEELGIRTFFDSEDIPQEVDGKEEWRSIRNRAIEESNVFILLITPGFDLSPEVRNELSLARKEGKQFIYFRHRDLGRKIVIDLGNERVDLGKQQQVSFETKEELLRHAHRILLKYQKDMFANKSKVDASLDTKTNANLNSAPGSIEVLVCAACSKPIKGVPHTEILNGKKINFDSVECAKVYRKLKGVYGEYFE